MSFTEEADNQLFDIARYDSPTTARALCEEIGAALREEPETRGWRTLHFRPDDKRPPTDWRLPPPHHPYIVGLSEDGWVLAVQRLP